MAYPTAGAGAGREGLTITKEGERASRRVRVGFDGRALNSPAAGIRRYTRELIKALGKLDDPVELVMLGGDPDERVVPDMEHVREPPHPPTNAGWMLVGLPLAVARSGVDLLHAPAYTAPFWNPVPTVLTIHDVSYARHPEWFPYRRDALRRAFYRRSALSAALVVTDSEFSAGEIRAAYGIAGDRLVVVPLGVSHAFTERRPGRLPSGVRQPFLLHVGDLHDRRNLGVVLRAVLAVRAREPGLALVLAGVDRGLGDGLRRMAEEAGAADAVVLLGPVDEPTLRALYGGAAALTYPSLYEGFGLPLLEAMACGTPVLASRAASIPEVVGDAGILLDPHDHEAWADAVSRVVGERSLAETLSGAGRARASEFTWERTARRTLAVYRGVLGIPRDQPV